MGNARFIIEDFGRLGRALSQHAVEKLGRTIHLGFGYAFMGKSTEWHEAMWEHGGMGPAGENWNGGCGGRGGVDLEAVADWSHEHECFMSFSINDPTIENGPISAIEEECKELTLRHKHMPKFAPNIVPTYWSPPEHIDAGLAIFKKYGRYE